MDSLTESATSIARDMRAARGPEWTPERVRRELVPTWRAASPDLDFHLSWEREEATSEYHFDVIVTAKSGESVIVTYCPNRRVPFVARGIYRKGEHDVLRVNGEPLTAQEAMAMLELSSSRSAFESLASRILVRQILDRTAPALVTPTDEEVSDGADAFRVSHGLFDAAATRAWLTARGMTWAMLLNQVRRDVMVAKLREHAVGGDVEAHFDAHARDFDRLLVEELELEPWADVDAYDARLAAGEPAAIVGRDALAAGDGTSFGTRAGRAWSLAPGADAGVTGRRASTDGRTVVYRIAERVPGELDARTRVEIADRLFDRFVQRRLRESHVEWHWGNVPARAADALGPALASAETSAAVVE